MQAGGDAGSYAIGGEECAQRPSRREPPRYRYDVGLDPVMLIRKVFPRSPKATLNLIKQKQCAGFLGQLTRQLQKLVTHWTNSALALNRLNANSADAAIELPLQIFHIIKCDEVHSG